MRPKEWCFISVVKRLTRLTDERSIYGITPASLRCQKTYLFTCLSRWDCCIRDDEGIGMALVSVVCHNTFRSLHYFPSTANLQYNHLSEDVLINH